MTTKRGNQSNFDANMTAHKLLPNWMPSCQDVKKFDGHCKMTSAILTSRNKKLKVGYCPQKLAWDGNNKRLAVSHMLLTTIGWMNPTRVWLAAMYRKSTLCTESVWLSLVLTTTVYWLHPYCRFQIIVAHYQLRFHISLWRLQICQQNSRQTVW